LARCLTLRCSEQVGSAATVPLSFDSANVFAICMHIMYIMSAFVDKGGDPEVVRKSQRERFAREDQVDKVLALDAQWREGTDYCSYCI
jgi:hypothetical protein